MEVRGEKRHINIVGRRIGSCIRGAVGTNRPNGFISKEFRKWAHVKSLLVGPQSAAFATEGGIHHIYANDNALEGYHSGKFPDGSVIVYDLLETKEVAGNIIEASTRRVDVMIKHSEGFESTGGWEFMSFAGNDQTNGKLTVARHAICAACHAHNKDHDSVFSEFRK